MDGGVGEWGMVKGEGSYERRGEKMVHFPRCQPLHIFPSLSLSLFSLFRSFKYKERDERKEGKGEKKKYHGNGILGNMGGKGEAKCSVHSSWVKRETGWG